MVGDNKSKNYSNGGWFMTRPMFQTFGYKSSFVVLDRSIKITFDPENLFIINYVHVRLT